MRKFNVKERVLLDEAISSFLRESKKFEEEQELLGKRSIIASFKNKRFYRDLTINEIDNIITFLPEEYHPEGRTDFYYGDFLIQKELKYKY